MLGNQVKLLGARRNIVVSVVNIIIILYGKDNVQIIIVKLYLIGGRRSLE